MKQILVKNARKTNDSPMFDNIFTILVYVLFFLRINVASIE